MNFTHSRKIKILAHSFRVHCLGGTLPLLRTELAKFGISALTVSKIDTNAVDIHSGMMKSDIIRDACKVLMHSRLAKRVTIPLGTEFPLRMDHTLRSKLRAFNWNAVIGTTQRVEVAVKSSNSRFGDHKNIRNLILETISESKQMTMNSQLALVGCDAREGSSGMKLYVLMDEDTLDVQLDVGGDSHNDEHVQQLDSKSRLAFSGIASNAIAISVLDTLPVSCYSKMHIWNPFVGSGRLCMSLASILQGTPAGSPCTPYPIKHLPCFDEAAFADIVDSLRYSDHPLSKHVTSIIATDSSKEAIQVAQHNYLHLDQRIPIDGMGGPSYKIPIDFRRVPDAFMVPTDAEKILLVTSLPCGGDFEKRFRHFHSMLDKLEKENRLVGAYVATNKSHTFRTTSPHRRWLTNLRIFDNFRRDVELLRLV